MSRVHFVDDDADVLQSIRMLLAVEGFDVETYASAGDFLEVVGPSAEGCVVTDERMPGMSGLELLSKIQERGLTTPVIVITGHGDRPLALRALRMGAFDFLEKPVKPEVLISSIRRALARRDGRDGELAQESRDRLSTLSAEEGKVLKGLLEGLPNQAIAQQLDVSPRAVETDRAKILKKMRAESLLDLVRLTKGVSQ